MKIGPLTGRWPLQALYEKTRLLPEAGEKNCEEKKDRVEISQEARKMLAELADRTLKQNSGRKVPAEESTTAEPEIKDAEKGEKADGTLTPERLAEIQRRIKTGFYERPEIKNKIIDRLTDDMNKE